MKDKGIKVPCKVNEIISIVYVEPKDLTKIQTTNYLPARKNRRDRRKLNRKKH